MPQIYEKLNENIKSMEKEVFPLAEWLTAHPEVGGEEKESSKYITDFLRKRGYEIDMDYTGLQYAFRAYKKSDKPRIAIMCEYDAIPEVGHACGHSLSCGISILSGLAIMETFKDFPYEIDFIGTPSEETFGGKVIIAKNGGFNGYEFAIMGHIDSINASQIRIRACNDMFITFKGTAAHASTAPWLGASALNAAQLFMHGIDLERVHFKPFMQMHGIVVEGGLAANTIPDKVSLEYYPRAATMKDLMDLNEKARRIAKGVAYATGTEVEIKQRYETFAELHYGKTATQTIISIFEQLGLEVNEMEYPEGSTDAGNVDMVIPTYHLELKGSDKYVNFHTVEFERLNYGERAKQTMYEGSCVIANFIANTAYENGLLDKLKEEHAEYRSNN